MLGFIREKESMSEADLNENRKRVYIAGPYTHGDWGLNQRRAIQAAQEVLDRGHIPFIPHTMTATWSIVCGNNWIDFDLYWVEVCDALIRLPGKSNGSDTEVEFAKDNDIDVYMSVEEFVEEVDSLEPV